MQYLSSENLVLNDCINSTTVVSCLSRSEKLAESRVCTTHMLSKVANSFTKNNWKVSCFKIDFVHVLPSPLLAPEGILDEIISIV